MAGVWPFCSQTRKSFAIRKFIRTLWLCFCWMALLIVVLAAVGGICALYQANAKIRQHVLKELESYFPGLEIDIGQVQIEEQKGISIRRVECHLPASPGRPKRLLAVVDEFFLECPVSIPSLIRKEVAIRKIRLNSPVIRISRAADGTFPELEHLKPQGQKVNPTPVEIRDGTILFEDVLTPQSVPLRISDIVCLITPPEYLDTKNLTIADLETAAPIPESWKAVGASKGDWFRQLNFEFYYAPETQSWKLNAACRQLDWTAQLLPYLRMSGPLGGSQEHQQTLESFQGRFDLDLEAASAPDKPFGMEFELNGLLSQGRAELTEIGRTLTEMSTKFRVTDDGVSIEKLSGLGEAARFVLSYSQEGLAEIRGGRMAATLRGLAFDPHFVKILSPFLNESTETLLGRFDYDGVTDLEASLCFKDGDWVPERIHLNLSELNFSFREFPYKVERLDGTFTVDASARLVFQLVTRAEDPLKVEINGVYENVFDDPFGEVKILGHDVPINAKLLASIPEEVREVIESLHPTGKINANLLLRLPPGTASMDNLFEISLIDVSVLYDEFRYPVREIQGMLRFEKQVWNFENLVGSNALATVNGRGFLRPVLVSDQAQSGGAAADEFYLELQIQGLPVDDQLFAALGDADKQAVLKGLHARGNVNLDAKVRLLAWEDPSRKNALNLGFSARPCPGLSIHPERFPYRIENLQGEVFYQDGRIFSPELKGTGRRRETRFSAGLDCRFAENGQWRLRLSPLTIDQLTSERELREALPNNFQGFVDSLKIENPINLRGSVEFSKLGESAPLQTVWDTVLILHNNNLEMGIPLENMFGTVRLTGFSVDEKVRVAGQLNLDSVAAHDFQATELTGPIFYDGLEQPPRFYIGQPAMKALVPPPDLAAIPAFRQSSWFSENTTPQPVRGKIFGGRFYCESIVHLDQIISYGIKAGLSGADLSEIAREMEPGAKSISGTLNAWAHLGGHGRKMETLRGNGAIELRSANIYEAPGMVRLLRELSIRESDPNSGAIKSADLDFRLAGNKVYFNQIVLEGGAFLLHGDGVMNTESRQIDLALKTRLGNRRAQIPVVSDIIGGAGDELVQIQVRGPLSDPTVKQIVAPRLQQVFLQGEDSSGGQPVPTPAPVPAKRGFFPW